MNSSWRRGPQAKWHQAALNQRPAPPLLAPPPPLLPPRPADLNRLKRLLVFKWEGVFCYVWCDGEQGQRAAAIPLGGPAFCLDRSYLVTAAVHSDTHVTHPPTLSATASSSAVCWCVSSRDSRICRPGRVCKKAAGGCCRAFGFLCISHSVQFELEPHSGRLVCMFSCILV